MNDREWTGHITVPSGTGITGPITIVGSPPEPVCRIDDDEHGGLDDVAIGPVEMFRLERMDKGYWWAAVYMADGSRHVFNLHSKKRITARHRKEPPLPTVRLEHEEPHR